MIQIFTQKYGNECSKIFLGLTPDLVKFVYLTENHYLIRHNEYLYVFYYKACPFHSSCTLRIIVKMFKPENKNGKTTKNTKFDVTDTETRF